MKQITMDYNEYIDEKYKEYSVGVETASKRLLHSMSDFYEYGGNDVMPSFIEMMKNSNLTIKEKTEWLLEKTYEFTRKPS